MYVAGGRALRVKPVGLFAVGIPAANSLSRIFVTHWVQAGWPSVYVSDSMPGSLDCAARGLQPPGYSVDILCANKDAASRFRLRNSSTTVMRRMLASKIPSKRSGETLFYPDCSRRFLKRKGAILEVIGIMGEIKSTST